MTGLSKRNSAVSAIVSSIVDQFPEIPAKLAEHDESSRGSPFFLLGNPTDSLIIPLGRDSPRHYKSASHGSDVWSIAGMVDH
jgi:hypothetical protein